MPVTIYRGHVRNGQIALDQPATLPEGAEVSVQLLQSISPESTARIDRRQILQMPIEQRRRLLSQQADRLADYYSPNEERADWQGGDILE
jgi:hypothetical protein